MEMAQSMFKAKNLPNKYWGATVKYVVYILNRCPTKSLENFVLEEAWTGRKLDVSHVSIFSCVAYAHVSGKLRQKLDNKSKKCIYLRYSDQSKVYLIYNLVTRKVVINRDVKFAEEEAWDGSIQTIIDVVGAEQIDEEVDPTHAPVEHDHEQQGATVPKGDSSSEGQAPSISISETSTALLIR